MSFVRDKDGARTNRIQARGDNWNKFEEYARQRGTTNSLIYLPL